MADLTPNTPQVQSTARWLISNVGTGVAAFAVGKGWITKENAAQILADPLVYTFVAAIGAWVWGLVAKTDKNLKVAVTQADPAAVIVTTAAVAAATPDSPNIVSSDQVKVVAK